MSANKTNINELYSEFYHYNQPVIITFNIKCIMLVIHIIHTIKGLFYISKASPFAFLDYGSPFLQCDIGIRMSFCIFFYDLFCKYLKFRKYSNNVIKKG